MSEENGSPIYCGKGREFSFNNGGHIVNVSICLEDVQAYVKQGKNGKHYVALQVCKLKQPDQYYNTHSVRVNTYAK